MATRYILTPDSAEMPAADFPELMSVHATLRRRVLAFDAGNANGERCEWSTVAVQGLSGTLTAIITYSCAVNTNDVVWEVSIEADTTPTDGLNAHTSDSFAAGNAGTSTVPGTVGVRGTLSITLTQNDSIAAGDSVRFRLRRDSNNGSDTAAGDAYVHSLEIRDAA